MAQYRDSLQGLHEVRITLLTRKQIRDALGVDLLAAAHNPDVLKRLLDDIAGGDLLWQILAVIESSSVDALLAVADGTTEEAAGSALLEAIIDFFPASSPLREPLRELARKTAAVQTEARQDAERVMLDQVGRLNIASMTTTLETPTDGSHF